MKKFARIASLLLALVMVLGLSATAFAADETYTITIESHREYLVYEAYQIFAGDVAVDESGNKILSNITWGANITEEGQTALLSFGKAEGEEPYASAAELAKALAESQDNDIAKNFAAAAEAYLTETPTATIYYTEEKGHQAEVPAGYYLIKNKDGLDMIEEDRTDLILEVCGDSTIALKGIQPTIWKYVRNNNDTTSPAMQFVKNDAGENVGIAVWDIGDDVYFRLNGLVPNDLPSYDEYEYIIHDEMSAGLTLNNSEYKGISVYAASSTESTPLVLDEDYTVALKKNENGTVCGFEVKMDLVKVAEKFNAMFTSSVKNIVVDYSAVLNENAAAGAHDNTNKAWIEYNGTTGTSTTAWVGTVQLVVNKVDENNNPLTGAEFKLYKFYQNDQNHQGTDTIQIGENEYVGVWEECENQFTVSEDGTVFTVKGLDGGGYKLVETKAPAGYNKAEDLIFSFGTVSNYEDGYISRMEVSSDNADQFTLTTRSITVADGEATEYIGLETTVINKSGTVLPSTGGIGTTLFYIVGAIMVLGAAILLVTKRRMSAQD